MKKKLILTALFIFIIVVPARASLGMQPSDYTGDAYFIPYDMLDDEQAETKPEAKKEDASVPPIKLLRTTIKKKLDEKRQEKLAPTQQDSYAGEIETSQYASKEPVEEFIDEEIPEELTEDASIVEEDVKKKRFFSFGKKEKKAQKKKVSNTLETEDIILDCDNVDYDTPNYRIYAKGNVNLLFVKQGTTVQSDIMTFDRISNTIKAEGNVKIIKGSQVVTGDYIFVDMNEENGLIENPVTKSTNIEMHAKKGYVYGDKIVQEDGNMDIVGSYPLKFHSQSSGPELHRMLTPEKDLLSKDMEKGLIRVESKSIKITQKGDLETVAFKKLKVIGAKHTILKVPAVKFYTNKHHEYVESNIWEVGSVRSLGFYTGPGWVMELPKGSVLKLMPMLNYRSGVGIGALGRFSSGTNQTTLGYGTAAKRFVGYGKQRLDDDLFLQYSINDYVDEWFLGSRRPKYGASLVYKKDYSKEGFLVKDKPSSFSHRIEAGYFHDLDFDNNYEQINSTNIGTTRFRYMAQANQNFLNYQNKEKLTAVGFDIVSQMSASLYGTGDTQVIGRIGPNLHLQYKRWMQDITYYFSAYEDNTPMPAFDAYRYGKQNLYIREYLRLCKYLTLSWFGSINLTNDAADGRRFQENAFYISVGPDDIKLSVGYDFIRSNMYCFVDVMLDAKGTNVKYDTLEIKQDKKAENKQNKEEAVYKPSQGNQYGLEKAVVENVKIMEDVL